MAVHTEVARTVPRRATTSRATDGALAALFIASGAAGLIYQVVWSRELVLVFGNTSQAISAIVTAFMLGLGLGGYAGGRLARRSRSPLRFYAALEILTAAYALLLPLSFNLVGDVYKTAYASLGPTELGFVRLALALAILTPVTFLMGMTLPVLTRFVVRDLDQAGGKMARLYAANTLGAALGTLVSGIVLIEILGLIGTSLVAAFLNLLAGFGALVLSASQPASDALPDLEATEAGADRFVANAAAGGERKVMFAATFVSGFIALALEVLWTRMLAEGTGSRIYIFVAILSVYLLGIAAGSMLYRRYSSSRRDRLTTLAVCFAGIGLTTTLTVLVASGVLFQPSIVFVFLTLIPPTLLMGYAFPLSVRLATRNAREAAESVGLVYAWNTAGAILGSFAAAFVLAGTIGTNGSILLLAALSLLLGAGLVAVDRSAHSARRAPPAIGMAVLALFGLAATVTRIPFTRTITENNLLNSGAPTTHLEDNLATVDALGGEPAGRRLYVSGTAMTALTIDTKLMAYLPKVLRPRAQRFLVIAFGMGSTYRSGLFLGMRTDAVELSPSVPGLMPYFFPDADAYLHHPNGKIIIGDGRNYVRLSNQEYDLIAVDPAPPIQSAGTVVLYTREFFEQGKQRLEPGGIFMLWLPYGESLPDFKDHLRTFRASFKHMSVVFGPGGYGVYMLGSDEALDFDQSAIERIFGSPAAQQDLAGAPDFRVVSGRDWPGEISRRLWLSDSQIDDFVGSGPLITDDHPRSEYDLLRLILSPDNSFVNESRLRAGSATTK